MFPTALEAQQEVDMNHLHKCFELFLAWRKFRDLTFNSNERWFWEPYRMEAQTDFFHFMGIYNINLKEAVPLLNKQFPTKKIVLITGYN